MELPRGVFGVKPPTLEDAGLEDTALSPEGIQQAFRIAAQKVRGTATGILDTFSSKDEGCAKAPFPIPTEWDDTLVDGSEDIKKPGGCLDTKTGGLIEDGRDSVVDGRQGNAEDKVVVGEETVPRLGESGCLKGDEESDALEKREAKNKEKAKPGAGENAPGLTEAAI